MRIKSNFKDYYDGCQQYNDSDIVFIRNKTFDSNKFSTFEVDKYLEYYEHEEKYFPNITSIAIIGVGNNLYPFIVKNDKSDICSSNIERTNKTIYIGLDGVENFIHNLKYRWDRYHLINAFDYIANYINSENAIELANRFGPVFILHNRYASPFNQKDGKLKILIEKTPKLSDFGMQKLLPPIEAYIAIERFLQNRANPAKPIPEMDNNTKIELAGFDKKTSFRKTKQ